MRNLNDFTDKEKRKPIDIACTCSSCHSSNCLVYKNNGDQKDIFDVICEDCDHIFIIRLPGLGDVL